MNILQEKCFTKEWLEQQREEMGRVDPGLLGKSIHALELVGLLAAKDLPFSFKGGICMLLLLEKIRRLSFDVDIACTVPSSELELILKEIGSQSRFENFEAKTCAAKVAWLATALKTGNTSGLFPRYTAEELQEMASAPLDGDWSRLNRLKAGNPEAYFYWLKVRGLNV